jgi:hypothetical protein
MNKVDINEIQQHLNKIMDERNNRGIPEFEGYSPFEMHNILHFTFNSTSPIQLNKLSDSDYTSIPLLNQVKYFINLISKNGEIKLTNKGFLPVKIVSELYAQKFLKEEFIESGLIKLYKETDSITINLTRFLSELAGLTKKRDGKLSLTKTAEKLALDNNELLKLIFATFAIKFNWAYYDRYGVNEIGQLGIGFSLILLSHYGNEKRLDSFYSKKYLRAFPKLYDKIEPTYGSIERYTSNCYSLRTFDRFLDYFGLVKIERDKRNHDSDKYILKTDLYDKFIKCTPPNTGYSQ